jgi:hypothetical protein
MAVPSNVEILYDGQNITNRVLYSTARFEAQASAGVGTFQLTAKDTERELSFTSGKEVVLILDGKRYFAGPLMQVGHTFAFPAVKTANLNQVTTRQFTLSGTNWNVLFDRRVTRNPQDYFHYLPARSASTKAGALLREFCEKYLDIPGINYTSYVDDIGTGAPGEQFLWKQQGTTWREQMQWLSLYNGAIYYIDANKQLHYHSPDTQWAAWGFSDRPNNAPVASDATRFMGALYGFRELNTDQDISQIVNDAFVWGGDQWTGEGEMAFHRATNPDSIATHGRWQHAEPINPDLIQDGVTELAKAIVGGPSYPYIGQDPISGVVRSQGVPAWTLSLTWFGHDVPINTNNQTKHHLTPGDIVTIVLWVHGSGPTKPLVLTLPLRSVSISFPTLPSGDTGNKTFVRFDGQFGLSVNDPHSLWQSILRRRRTVETRVTSVATSTGTQVPGAQWSGAPTEQPDGTRKTFTLMAGSAPVRYIAGTSEVHLNGLRMRQGADYSESPNAGTISFFSAPRTGSNIWIYVRMAA